MNLLAHAYLSFGDPEITVGNLISDFVKGRKQYDYPTGIRNGIVLHRSIDQFTDASEATRSAKEFFRSAYRLYSGPFTDVIYDYFLANDEQVFSEDSLYQFSQQVYAILEEHARWLPADFAAMLPYMKKHNWLFNYRTKRGIENSLNGLVRRSAYLTEAHTAMQIFDEHEAALKGCYQELMRTIMPYVRQRLDALRSS